MTSILQTHRQSAYLRRLLKAHLQQMPRVRRDGHGTRAAAARHPHHPRPSGGRGHDGAGGSVRDGAGGYYATRAGAEGAAGARPRAQPAHWRAHPHPHPSQPLTPALTPPATLTLALTLRSTLALVLTLRSALAVALTLRSAPAVALTRRGGVHDRARAARRERTARALAERQPAGR